MAVEPAIFEPGCGRSVAVEAVHPLRLFDGEQLNVVLYFPGLEIDSDRIELNFFENGDGLTSGVLFKATFCFLGTRFSLMGSGYPG